MRLDRPAVGDHHERVPVEAGEHVVRAGTGAQPAGRLGEHRVADLAPAQVGHAADTPEPERHHHAGAGPFGQHPVQFTGVGEAGQLVDERDPVQGPLQLLALPHIAQVHHESGDLGDVPLVGQAPLGLPPAAVPVAQAPR